MVVVGRGGRFSRVCWAAARCSYGPRWRSVGRLDGVLAPRWRGRRWRVGQVGDPVPQGGGEGDDLVELLPGERQPLPQDRIQRGLGREVDRYVQQGAGRRHGKVVGQAAQRGADRGGVAQVGAPHVVTVDQPGHDGLVDQPAGGGEPVEVGGPGDQVQPDRLDRGVEQGGQGVAEVAEVAGHEQPRPVGQPADPRIDVAEGVDLLGCAVGDVRGLVQLHPTGAGVGQRPEDVHVHVDEVGEPVERAEPVRGAGARLGQQQERGRADEHRPGGDAERGGLGVLGQRLGRPGREAGVGADLGDQVVVVGVEPLGQLQRRLRVGAAGHGEVGVQFGQLQPAEPVRDRVDHDRRVENVVVEGERVGRDRAEPRVTHRVPGLRPQRGGLLVQGGGVDAAGPVRLHRALEFTVRADAGVAEHGADAERLRRPVIGCGHGSWLPSLEDVATDAGKARPPGRTQGARRGHGPPTRPSASTPTGRGRAVRAGLRTRGRDPARVSYRPSLPGHCAQCSTPTPALAGTV
jgi:hypothetical protein